MISSVLAEQGADVVRFNCNRLEEDITCHAIDTGFGKFAAWLDLDRPDDLVRYVEMVRTAATSSPGIPPRFDGQAGTRGARRLAQIRPGSSTSVSATATSGHGRCAGIRQRSAASTSITFEHGSSGSPMYAPVQMLTDYGTGYLGALGTLLR